MQSNVNCDLKVIITITISDHEHCTALCSRQYHYRYSHQVTKLGILTMQREHYGEHNYASFRGKNGAMCPLNHFALLREDPRMGTDNIQA